MPPHKNREWASRTAERVRESSERYIGGFCIALVEAAGNRHSGKAAAEASRTAAFSFSSAATMEVSSTTTAESRPKAQTPRVNIASVCPDSLSQAPRRGFRIEL